MLNLRSKLSLAALLVGVATSGLYALPARAVTLADVGADGYVGGSQGVEFSDFKVKIGGKGLSSDLSDHLVTFENGGIQIQLAPGFEGKRGKLKLSYVATSLVGAGLDSAGLAVDGEDAQVRNKLRGLGNLAFRSGSPDKEVLDLPFDAVEAVRVKSKVVTVGGVLVSNSFAKPVPEPGTAALLGLGMAGLAGARRRRSSQARND